MADSPHTAANTGDQPPHGDPRGPAATGGAAAETGPASPPAGHPLENQSRGGNTPHATGKGYEHSDVNVRALTVVAVGLAGVTVLAMIALYVLFGVFERAESKAPENQTRSLVTGQSGRLTGNGGDITPPLQGIPGFHRNTASLDMNALRQHNERALGSYGWTNEPNVARIPIDRAMELALERGLFKNVQPAPATRRSTGSETQPAGERGVQ